MPENTEYEVIGGGAAGMTATMYAGRARLKTLLIEKSLVGGQATGTAQVENYPGFPGGIDGTELVRLFDKQARKFDREIAGLGGLQPDRQAAGLLNKSNH
jgi:thioredoxin reductase (NADPH)